MLEGLELCEHSQSLASLGAGSSIRKHTCSKKLLLQKGVRQCGQQEKLRGRLQLQLTFEKRVWLLL